MTRIFLAALMAVCLTTTVFAAEMIPEAFRGTWTEIDEEMDLVGKLEIKDKAIAWTRPPSILQLEGLETTESTDYTINGNGSVSFVASIAGPTKVFWEKKPSTKVTMTLSIKEQTLVLSLPAMKIESGANIWEKAPETRTHTREGHGPSDTDTLIKIAIAKLRGGVNADRDKVMGTLLMIGPSSTPALIEVLNNAKKGIARMGAATVLSSFCAKSEPAVLALAKAMDEDSDPDVRLGSLLAIKDAGEKARLAIPSLTKALDDPREEATQCAMIVLSKCAQHDGTVLAKIKKIADDPARPEMTREFARTTLTVLNGSGQEPGKQNTATSLPSTGR